MGSSFWGLVGNVTGCSLWRLSGRRPACSHGIECRSQASGDMEPLLLRAARGETVDRPPCWMMRQAGRYQKAYRDLAERHPDFRQRSETTDLIVEITLQPWKSFRPDGLILFSDILTPLAAMGVPFDIDDARGPVVENTVRSMEQVRRLHALDLGQLQFVGEALSVLRQEVGCQAAVLGFVGCPWTLATYVVEGHSTTQYKTIKTMAYQAPDVLDALLSHLAEALATYMIYQIESGAQAVQMFDSWGSQLPPHLWDRWSQPYIMHMVRKVKAKHPDVPLTLYAMGSGGLVERLGSTGVDVVGLDWMVDMADARARLGPAQTVQGNVDPMVLFADEKAIDAAVRDCVAKAGERGHILNLGYGVTVGTPEENVKYMFDLSKTLTYKSAAGVA